MRSKISFFFFFLLCSAVALAQSSDDLFQKARTAAFDKKDYPQAINLCKQALVKSPDYSDIRIFIGRLYTWSSKADSARIAFEYVLDKQPDNEDATLAYTNLEYWNDNFERALTRCNTGLKYHTQSIDLLLLKANILNASRNYKEANEVARIVLKLDPKNAAARRLVERIKDNSSKNKIGLTYDFVKFDKQFNDPWHLASIDYTRQTSFGSVIGRFNYANRFSTNGTQFEIDAYPSISKTFYAYLNAGYSNNVGVFAKYRAGMSLYANLPYSFEAEGGFRYLNFGSQTWIYTASIGKYYKNYWFNIRTFQTPSNNSISQSYSLNIRYYYGGADDFLSLRIGTGLSPDDAKNSILLNPGSIYKLYSNNITIGYRHAIKTLNIVLLSASFENQEYRINTFGNQLQIGFGYQRKF